MRKNIVASVALLAVLAFVVSGCGKADNGITSPSGLERNLNSAPPGAFEIGNPEITVRFWFDITPPPGSVVGAGDTTKAVYECRANSGERYLVRVTPTRYVAPDGSEAPKNDQGILLVAGGDTSGCAPGNVLIGTTTLSPTTKFVGLKEVQFQAKLERVGGGGGSPTIANFVQPVGWTAR